MKRIFALVLSFAVLFSCLVLPAGAMFDPTPVYQVQAQSAYIVNTDTNIIVYDKDSTKQVSAGGLTKYMTIALLLTNYADHLDDTFQMPFAISDYVYNTNNADMRSNETFTYREAMYAMLTRNANEAAMGLAYALSGGDLAGWVSQMNTLSQRIGTTGSTWTDACGIDSGNVTCAVDMYLILRYLMSFDAFVEVSGAPSFTMPAKEKHRSSSVLVSQNAALSKSSGGKYYRSAMQGGMCDVTAFKSDSGNQSYVSWANKDGATYIFCVMQSPDTCDDFGYANRRPALCETVKLMDWVFDSFSIQAALDTDLTLAEIPVKYSSDTSSLQLYPADSMMTRNANEAAMGLAYALSGGDLAGWVSQMNTLSQRIGTTGSTWTDACGIDSGNVTCAVDMYLILRYLMSFDAFVEVSGAPSFTMPAKEKHRSSSVLVSQNAALSKSSGGKYYRSAMQGGMCDVTAFKSDSGNQSYVSWANKDGATYIFCVMQSPDTCDDFGYANRRPALCETVKLMDWVFDSFSIQAALDTDLTLAEIPVKYSSDTSSLQLYPADSMMTLLPSTGDGSVTQKYFHLPDAVSAPIQQGDVVGTVELKLAGETIGVVDLIAGQDVSLNPLLFTVARFREFLGSLYLKVVITLSIISAAIYFLWTFLNGWNRRKPTRKIRRR